jgi:hypothetical protein
MTDHPTHEEMLEEAARREAQNELLSIQTVAAFERLKEALTGKTDDNFKSVVNQINSLLERVEKIDAVSNELNH